MKGKNKTGNVKKHRGNPHGNAPEPEQSSRGEQNKSDRLRSEGTNSSVRSKQ